jgi:curli biogenesis system outer membrane secretion channel CsgG
MKKFILAAGAMALAMGLGSPAMAADKSSARKQQEQGTAEIPRCTRNLGTIALIDAESQWWRRYGLQNPEGMLKIMIQRSGCFTIVNRGRSMNSRAMERALADSGELQRGSNLGKRQVKAADYFLEPDIITANNKSGGNSLGGLIGGFGGAVLGGIKTKKSEANVTLSVVNTRTTVEEALTEGYARKTDLRFAGGGGGFLGGVFAAVGGGGYQNTEIGQVIVLAYLDAYTKLVTQLGGLPYDAASAAPQAE